MNKWKESIKLNKDNPTVIKLEKKRKLNILLWVISTVLAIGLGVGLTLAAIKIGWENPGRICAIALPWVLVAVLIFMDIIVILGNKSGVMTHNNQTIIFYSGILTNFVYIDGVLTSKGSDEKKLACSLSDGWLVNIVFKLVSFDILVTPPTLNNPENIKIGTPVAAEQKPVATEQQTVEVPTEVNQ